MRTFKTSKKKRTNYTYYPAAGAAITITPDDVGENWIEMLHDDDDATIDADRRELYHTPYRHDGWNGLNDGQQHAHDSSSGAATNGAERLGYMADTAPDPLESIIESIENQEHEETLEKLKAAIQTLQPQQIDLIHKVFYEKRTNTDIAAEEGVTEAAIRNRLKKIYANLAKKLLTY